ncbi:trimethylamine methyltransferase family protein, partial [Planktomarina temperata]|nr:trimethylamine methyltransferase family protein [Planktomarina temperata]
MHLRHYAMMQTQMGLGDKAVTVYGRGRQQVQECFEIIQTALGLSAAEFSDAPYCSTVINTNSPRMLDKPMAQALIDFARAGQMCIVTPFCLAGAMAPITIAGALTLQHAEALAAITLNQLAKPGAPVMYGGFGSNVDMKSGAPSFGTPEHIQMSIGSGQLARHIGLPWRSAAGAAANTNDMQATHETVMSLWGCLQANATMVIHAAGWLEGGLTFGFEKFIQDIEALQAIAHLCKPVAADAAAIGLDAIEQVAPGGHFFETDQTLNNYSTAFLEPINADLSNFGTWQKNGALTAEARATAKWQAILHDFTAPAGCSGAGWPRGGNDRAVYPSRRGTDSRVSPCTSSCKGLSQTAAGSALLESGQIPVAIRNPRELALIEPWFFYLAPTCTYRSSGIQYQHGCSGGPATSCFRMHRLFDPQSAPSSV